MASVMRDLNQPTISSTMDAWVLYGPNELKLEKKQVPEPGPAEVLVRVDAIAICATDLEILRHGTPALIEGESPFHKGFTPGHEYMGTVVKLGPYVDEFEVGERVVVEVHAGCGRCERCRQGMQTSCLNYSSRSKGHRANGFTTDGCFAQYAVNHVGTLTRVPDNIPDDEATLAVTSGTAMYGLDALGGLLAGDSIVISGPGPIGLMAVACAKALGANPVILTGTRESRLVIGRGLGADNTVNVREENPVDAVRRLTHGEGVDFVLECSGSPNTVDEGIRMLKRGGKICLAAFPNTPVEMDLAYLVRNNIYLYGNRGEARGAVRRGMSLMGQRKFDAKPLITHRFPLSELETALRYAAERIDDAIKVVVTP